MAIKPIVSCTLGCTISKDKDTGDIKVQLNCQCFERLTLVHLTSGTTLLATTNQPLGQLCLNQLILGNKASQTLITLAIPKPVGFN